MNHSFFIYLLSDDTEFSGQLSEAVSNDRKAEMVSCPNLNTLSQRLQQHESLQNAGVFLDAKYASESEKLFSEQIKKDVLFVFIQSDSDTNLYDTKMRAENVHRLNVGNTDHLITLLELIKSRSIYNRSNGPQIISTTDLKVNQELLSLGANAASVAHDFNNILTTILGRTQMLLLEATNQQSLRNLESIERTARDGVNVVNQIMRFLSANEEQNLLEEEINSVVSNAVAMVKESARFAETPGINCEVFLCSRTFVKLDPTMFTQVLMNIMFNSVDAMPQGGNLKIEVGREKQSAIIQIQDNGDGINKEDLDKVFEPFYSSKGTKGTGLGLATSRRIVSQHSGTMRIMSEKSTGTTVVITLPTVRNIDVSQQNRLSDSVQNNQRKSAQILVVDDDESILEILAEILRTSHHTVITAQSAEEGLKRFENEHFDVVFTDLDMPEKSGLELASAIRKLGSEAPIAFITGWGTSLDPKRVEHLGVSRTFPKPFKAAQVLDWVAMAVTNSEL